MKYIRTEGGEVRTTIHLYKNEDGSYSNANREIFGLPRIIAVKEADSIEELCDCFVDYCEEYDSHLVYNEKPVGRKNYVVYGAIWTNKGLIYVAKMNDNGELELL